MDTIDTVTLPMAGIGETITIPNVPREYMPTLLALSAAGKFTYGPTYSRAFTEDLRDLARSLSQGDTEAAAYWHDLMARRWEYVNTR